jgi:hypothetical protein
LVGTLAGLALQAAAVMSRSDAAWMTRSVSAGPTAALFGFAG